MPFGNDELYERRIKEKDIRIKELEIEKKKLKAENKRLHEFMKIPWHGDKEWREY